MPSPPPALLDTLTDELLVVASDVINAVAAEAQPTPSGKSLLRILAWLVADARGAVELLDKADAAKAGKRLDYQAKRIRESLAEATWQAETERARIVEQEAERDTPLTPAEAAEARAETRRSGGFTTTISVRCTLASTSWSACCLAMTRRLRRSQHASHGWCTSLEPQDLSLPSRLISLLL